MTDFDHGFHDPDALDTAEQLLFQQQAIVAQLQAIIRKHRVEAPRIATHDGSVPGSPVETCSYDPPSREAA